MIDWFHNSFECRLGDWKQFREQIKDYSTEDKLKQTAEFFRNVPYCNRCIDYYTPESWPDPWELINSKVHCLSTISLMMYYTLKFVEVDVNILLINDGRDTYLMPYHEQSDTILNYNFGQIDKLTICEEIKVIEKINI